MRLDRPWGLVGQIKTTSSGFLINLPPPDSRLWLSGRITTQSTGRFHSPPNAFFAGHIKTVAQARIARPGKMLAAKALTVSSLSGDALHIGTYFKGRIKTTWWAGISPTAAILSGQISTTSFGHIRSLPLLPTKPPPVCTLDVKLDDYLDLITSKHIGKPLYVRMSQPAYNLMSMISCWRPGCRAALMSTSRSVSSLTLQVNGSVRRGLSTCLTCFSVGTRMAWDGIRQTGRGRLTRRRRCYVSTTALPATALCDNRCQPLGWQHPQAYRLGTRCLPVPAIRS